MSDTKGKSNAPWNECIGQMKGQQGVSRRNAQADFLRLNDFLDAKFKGTSYKIGTSPAFQVGNRYGINPDLLKGVKKIPSQYIIASSGQVLHGENTGDIFGWSTDLSEDGLTLAVGSILNDNTNGLNSGSVRVYTRSNPDEAWVQKGVDIDGEAAQDYSGWSIALSADGDRLVIGAVFNDDGGNINTGHVRIYDWNAGTSQWVSVTEINGGAGDFFGYSVSLSRDKNRLAVGAPYGLSQRGYVSVYYNNSGAWQKIQDVAGPTYNKGKFGKRLSLNDDGTRLVVSAPHALGDTGVVYFYAVNQSAVNLLSTKMGPGPGMKFGHTLDLKGNTLVVADLTSLPLKMHDMSSDTFVTQAAPAGIFRSSETKVKLSQDGNVVLLSMPALNTEDNVIDSNAIKQSSFNKLGLVKIFARDGDTWKQRGWDMKSYASNNDEFGRSISISGDGLIVCISAPRKDDLSTDRGCVTAHTVRPISYYVKPKITLLGLNPQPVEANTSYAEAGAITDTGAVVTIVGDIEDNSVEGRQYTVRYTAASAFDSTTVERTVVITKDSTVPVLTFNGDAVMKVPIDGVFNDPGVRSNIPATITADVSRVNFQEVGEYQIEYTAVSTYGISSTTLIRRIFVVYDIQLEIADLVGRATCLSKDGFIAGTGDFVENSVILYEWDSITPVEWKKIGQKIVGPDNSGFGAALDLSTDGLTIAIGAPGLTGMVRVYQYNFLVNTWEQKGGDITGVDNGDKIGEFLCISGDGDVISTGSATPTSTKNPYIFSYRYSTSTDSWTKFHEYVEPFKLPSNVVSKPFSGSLNSSGTRLLLGVPVNNYSTGAIFLFDLNTDHKLVSIFGDAVGANLGQSVKLTSVGDTFVYGDVSAACVKVYATNAATGFWGQLGESITESYSSSGEFGKFVDISRDGTIVTFSDPSTSQGKGQIYQYNWDALNLSWGPNMVDITNNITGSFFGRKFYVTEDASKILTESSFAFQYFRWNVARPTFSINGTRILRLSIDQGYDYSSYVTSLANVTVTGAVNPAVTNDYVVKYTMTNDNNLSEVAYQIVSVSGGLLQLGLDVKNFDASSTPPNLGRSASMSSDGTLIAVGLPGHDGDTGMVKIYQFNRVSVHWDLQATVLGPASGSSFGYSVCLSKNGARLAIGAPGTANGFVRVYAYGGATWNQLGSDLTGTTGGKFGFSVALNLEGSNLVVGEPRKSFDVNTGAGVTRMFSYTSSQWTEISSMTNNQLEHELGHSVAITSTTNVFLSGAPMAGPGYVKLSSYIGGNVPIFAPTMVFGEKFGWSVTVSDDGNTFAVGAPYYNNKTGRVLVFDATTSPPSPKGSPIVGGTSLLEFGLSVYLSGDGSKLMVYAGNGRVSTFRYTNSQWTLNADETITSSETSAQFGYALASSGDGRRMLISAPLVESGSGLVQVYSTETTQITNGDFVGPTLSLNGPINFTVGQGDVFTDPGVRRDDGLSGFIATGALDLNTIGVYNLTYSAVDDSGNANENTPNRTVTVTDVSSNNSFSKTAVNSAHNAGVQMSGDGTRFAVASGALETTYVSDQNVGNGRALHGSVKVYQIDESVSPTTFTQVSDITDNRRYFANSIQMNQSGTRIAAMHTPDSDSTDISVYETGNNTHVEISPFSRLDDSFSFDLPTHGSIAPITGNAVNLFGRSGDRQSYRYRNLATSSDGTVVAIGKPVNDGTDCISVYKLSGDTVTIGTMVRQGGAISPTNPTSTRSDISSTGGKIIFCANDTTFIYNTTSGNAVKEAEFPFTENVNAISDNGSMVAFPTKSGIGFFPITLLGGDRISIEHGSVFAEPGYTYTGPDYLTVTGTVDTSQQGEYIIQYQTSTNTQIRIVNVRPPVGLQMSGSHSTTNVPYGPGFAGWTGTWRSYDFTLFTVPAEYSTLPNGDFFMSINLNGTIPVAGSTQYQSIQVFTDGGFSSSIDFTSNGSQTGVSYSFYSGSTYLNRVLFTSTVGSGSLSGGDVVKGRLHLYNTYYSTFSVDVSLEFRGVNPAPTPIITLTGFSDNFISTGEDFVDPGFTSDDPGDTLSTYIPATFPQSVSCRKAIVYRAVRSGLVAYAVRYVEVAEGSGAKITMYHYSSGWSQFANDIVLSKDLDLYDTDVALSESGLRVAISKYIQGQGLVFTYEYSQLTFPPAWVQYGSTIQISGNNRKPGFSLALSGDGNRLVIGSPGDANTAGEVYVYDYDTTNGWVKRNQDLWSLTSSNFIARGLTGYSMDLYGHSVDISKDGAHIAVGSPLNVTGIGHVSVYTLSGANFILKGKVIVSSSAKPEFGRDVSITDTGLAFVTNAGASVSGAGSLMEYRFSDLWYKSTERSFSVPVASAAISEDGNKILTVTDVVEVFTISESQVPGGQWEQLGLDITLASITAPGVDTNPSPSAGSRYSPGMFKPTNSNVTGYAVDISHDGTILAIGLPFLEMGGGDPFVVNSRGAAAVFNYDGLVWNQVGGTIVPKYVHDSALTGKYDGATSVTVLNDIAEANTFSGADISISGDGQYICVGSPGYLSNPIDLQAMDSLPNEGGMTFWTLYRRNSAWAPANDLYNVGWEPVVRRDSELSESLSGYNPQSGSVNEKKRELLGLGLEVSSDGSFVAFDTRTDGVKVLAESSGVWSVQGVLETAATTAFLKTRNMLDPPAVNGAYTLQPSAAVGFGNFPAKYWPVSYISLSSNDKYLSVSQPLLDPLDRGSSTTNQQVEDLRLGQVAVFKSNNNTRQKRRDIWMQQFLNDVRQNQGSAEETLGLYEPLTTAMSKDGLTIAIASPFGKLDANGDPDFIDTAALNAGFTVFNYDTTWTATNGDPFRSWIQVYTYSANQWIEKGALIAPQQTGEPENSLKLYFGQHMALSSNGSRLIVSGVKESIHEVYVFDYDTSSATWITTSGDPANMEKIYAGKYRRHNRMSGSTNPTTNQYYYEESRVVAEADLHGGTYQDVYGIGSVSGVAISDNGTRIAISFANYSAIDLTAATTTGGVVAGTQRTSQCFEMVLLFEYHSNFHTYAAWETNPPNFPVHGDVFPFGLNVFPRHVNMKHFDLHWGAGLFSTGRTRTGWNTIPMDARSFENVYMTGGTHMNWKLLHWEIFTAELDLDAPTTERFKFSVPDGVPSTSSSPAAIPHKGIPHSTVSGLRFCGNDAVLIERYDNAAGGSVAMKEYVKGQTGADHFQIRDYNANRYPCLLVYNSAYDRVTSTTSFPTRHIDSAAHYTQSLTHWFGQEIDSGNAHTYPTEIHGVAWQDVNDPWDAPDTRALDRDVNGPGGTRHQGWWFNDHTGWMLLDFSTAPTTFEDVPYSVAVSDNIGRVVFGIPQAVTHRGKIEIFDVSTESYTQQINGSNKTTHRYVLSKVGDDIYGDAARGRFGETVSISGDGSRVAVGNRPFYKEGTSSDLDTRVPTKFYVYEHDATANEFNKTMEETMNVISSLENPGGSRPTLSAFHKMFYFNLDDDVYSKWGRPPCFGMNRLSVGHSLNEPAQIKLTASDGAKEDGFGRRVSIDGDTMVIGADSDDVYGSSSGSAYVFARTGDYSSWKQVAKLTPSDGDGGDNFGYSVSIDGDTIVVGAYMDDIGSSGSAGSAYVFTRDTPGDPTSDWTISHNKLTGDGGTSDYFGFSVSIDGDTIVVGERGYDSGLGTNLNPTQFSSGSAYVFTRNTPGDLNPLTDWTQRAKLLANDETANALFGYIVSIDSDTVVIGAPTYGNSPEDGGRGSAYVFTRDTAGDLTSSWTQLAKLTANDRADGDRFGFSVAVDGDTVVIGAYANDDDGVDSGSAYVFTRDTAGDLASDWTQVAKLTADDAAGDDWFGNSASIDGDTMVIGAQGDEAAYVFKRDTAGDLASGWTQTVKLTADDGTANDDFGCSVSIDGETIVVGARSTYHGSAYVFLLNNPEILEDQQQVWVDSRYRQADVKLSSDGTKLLVSVFNRFQLYNIGGVTSKSFSTLGDAIIGETNANTWGVDDFAYSHSTVSDNGLSMTVPQGVIPTAPSQNYEKRINIYDFDRDTNAWGLRISSVVEGTEITAATFPAEYNFISALSKNRSMVSSFYLGPTQPVFRQYLVSTVNSQQTYNKISTLSLTSLNINAQPFTLNPLLPNERIADFTMSEDGTKIAIGNARGVTRFTTINARKEMGSVSVFTYDTESEEWISQLISIPDSSTYVNSGFVSSQFGTRVKLLPDGNSLVVSAPSSRDGEGDIFFFDTSSTTAITQKSPPYANPSSLSQGMFGSSIGISDDYTQLFVGDPGHNSGVGRIIVVGYDGSSWGGAPQYITRNRAPEAYSTTRTDTIFADYGTGYQNILTNTYNGGSFGAFVWRDPAEPRLTGNYNASGGMWLPVKFESTWTVSFKWNPSWNYSTRSDVVGPYEMRFIFYAPNQPSSLAGSQHGGYSLVHEFDAAEHTIMDPTDTALSTVSLPVDYGFGRSSTVTISYDNGVLTTSVDDRWTSSYSGIQYGNLTVDNRTYTFTGSDLSAQQALWGQETYICFAAVNGNYYCNQYIQNIDISYDVANSRSLSTNPMFGRDFDVTNRGDRLISSFLGESSIVNDVSGIITPDNTVAGFNEYFTSNSGLEIAEVFKRDAAGVWGLDSSVPARLKIEPQLGGTGMVESLIENTSIQPTVKISGTGSFSMFGLPSLKKLSGNTIERQSTNLNLLTNFQNVTPVISLVGDSVINIAVGTSFTDPGAVTDVYSDTIVVGGDQVDINVVGTYVVRYTVTRLSLTNFVERTFTVFVPSDPPTLTLLGSASVSFLAGQAYTEPDPPATFTGGALETYGVPPDGSVPGTFRVRYVVRNGLGIASVERVITVEPDTTPPALTILGGNVVHKVNTNYRDPSYVGSDGNEEIFTTTPSYMLGIDTLGQFRGVTSVTYSATDQFGNTGTSVRSVTVKDDFEAASAHTIGDSHSSALSSTGNRVASMVGQDVSLHETGGALVNTWTGLGSLVGQMVDLNSDGTIVAFTTTVGVYVYEYTTSWVERPPHSSYPRFTVSGSSAYRIDLSDDGDTLAVSYPGGTAAFTEEVTVFRWNATTYALDYNQGSATTVGLGTAMSLNSDGTRLVLGYPGDTLPSASITSPRSYSINPSPTLNGVTQRQYTFTRYTLTRYGQYGSNNTMYWQLNLGASWNCSWDWYVYGPRWGGADDMRLIYFAPNPITAYQASTHGGYNNFYEFWQGDTHQIRDNNDVYKKTRNVYYGTSRWLKVDVSYDNGVMTSTVREIHGTKRLVSTLSHDFGTAHQHLYNTPTYFGFSGRTGGVSATQYIENIQLTGVDNVGVIEVFDRVGVQSWSRVGSDINGGTDGQKLGTVVKVSGDGSTILNVNKGRDGNQQKVSVFTLNSGTWTKNATLLDSVVTRTFGTDDTDDLVDLSDDGSMVVYAKGTGTETYATHPNGLTSKYLDGFKLDGGVYKHVFVTPLPSDSINHVSLAGDASRALVQCGTDTSVFDVTETVFDPIITLTQDDDVDTLTVVGTYTEQGATSNVTDGSSVTVGGDTVTAAAGTYRVTYSVTDSNTGRSGFRMRVVIISEA